MKTNVNIREATGWNRLGAVGWRLAAGGTARAVLALLVAGLVGGLAAGGETAPPAVAAAAIHGQHVLPRLAIPRAKIVPALTADSEDPAWRVDSPAAPGVIDGLPLAMGSPAGGRPLPTRVLGRWTPQALFIRFVVHDPEPPFARPGVEGRDAPHYQSDSVEVFVDPVGDGRQTAEIQLNSRNEVFDQLLLFTSPPLPDERGVARNRRELWSVPGWNLKELKTAVAVFDKTGGREDGGKGWIADFALPAAGILERTGAGEFVSGQVLRAHFQRYKHVLVPGGEAGERRLLAHTWAPINFGCPHTSPTRQGFLELLP